MDKIKLALIASGLLLAYTAWTGWTQQRWINRQNIAIATSLGTTPKQHSNPLWPLLGLGGAGALAFGSLSGEKGGSTKGSPPTASAEFAEQNVSKKGHSFFPRAESPKNTQASNDSWLSDFFKSAYHVALNGATRSGKTTLCEWAISQLGDSEIYLIDPKYAPHRPRWNYTPNCLDINDVPLALNELIKRMEKRRNEEEPETPLHIIIDEWDWIKEEHGKSVISKCRQLFKVGAELGIKLWVLGQTPLAKDSGFSGSDYRNFGRIVLAAEALAFTKNPQFSWDSKQYSRLCESLQKEGKRFGLFIPMSGEPFVREIPNLQARSPLLSSRSPEPFERSPDPPERAESKWLNALLEEETSPSERGDRWEPRDPLNDAEPSPESRGMLINLIRSGCRKQEAIEYTWRCKKGGSAAYKRAEKMYQQIKQELGV